MKLLQRNGFTTMAGALAALALACLTPGRAPAGEAMVIHPSSAAQTSPVQSGNATRLNVNHTPRGFIPNVGQLASRSIKFALRDRGVSAFFTSDGFVLWNGQFTTVARDGTTLQVPVTPRWSLVGARSVEPVAGNPFDHTVSYFRGNNPAHWHSNLPAFRDIRYPGILSGVEMRVESRE